MKPLCLPTLFAWSFALGGCAAADPSAAAEPSGPPALRDSAPPQVIAEAEPALRGGLLGPPDLAPCYLSRTWPGSTKLSFHVGDLSEGEWARLGGREAMERDMEVEFDEQAIPPRFALGREFVVVGVNKVSTARVAEFYLDSTHYLLRGEPWVELELAEPMDGLILIVLPEHMPPALYFTTIAALDSSDPAYENAYDALTARLESDSTWAEGDWTNSGLSTPDIDLLLHSATLRDGPGLLAHGSLLTPRLDVEKDMGDDGGCSFEWEVYKYVNRSAVVDERGEVLRWVDMESGGDDYCESESNPVLTHVADLDGDGHDDWIAYESCGDFTRYVWIRETAGLWSSIHLGYHLN